MTMKKREGEFPKGTRQAMTKEQQALFMDYAKDSYLYNLFAVMLCTGMRYGEIRGLKYSDIDRGEHVIHVRRTIRDIEGQAHFKDMPKGWAEKRDIPLTDDLMALLDAQQNYWGSKIENPNHYLFCNEKLEALGKDSLQREIDRIVKRIRADGHDFERITPHVFRHTFVTKAIDSGMLSQDR